MLKFEDERTIRCRGNTRAIRRTLLRLTLQLSRNDCQPTRNFVRLLSGRNSVELVNRGNGGTSGNDSSYDDPSLSVRRLSKATEWLSAGSFNDFTPVNEVKENPYDSPVSDYIVITRVWLLSICELMLKHGYSISYIRRCLCQLRSDCGDAFPLTLTEFNAFLRSIVVSKINLFPDRRKQSDYVYAMSEKEYENMRVYSMACVRAALEHSASLLILENFRLAYSTKPYNVRLLLFSYLYLMLYHTGKRCGDVCILSKTDLRVLLETGTLAIRIPKTDRIGRLSMHNIERPDEFRSFLELFLALMDRDDSGVLQNFIPFDMFAARRRMNITFLEVYEAVNGRKKPRGLSFHSLRRRKAAQFFKDGEDLEAIRESLDHKDTRTTNLYINKFLLSESKRQQGNVLPSV